MVITTAETVLQGTIDDGILLAINKAIAGQFRFMFAKATSKNSIILQTPNNTQSSATLCFDNETWNRLIRSKSA